MSDETPIPPAAPLPGRAYEVLTPGEKFGNYQVLRCVSYDLLGSLYRVRKPKAKEEQTVFVMPPLLQPTSSFKARFSQMAPKLCGLEHENVFSFGEASEVKERFTFTGGPFDGKNLADHVHDYVDEQLKERGRSDEARELVSDLPIGLPPDEVRSILTQVLEGLAFLHGKKIQHFNLNPTNILRSEDGRIMVAGFGLMNLIGQEAFEEIVSAGIPPIALGGRAIRVNTVDILSPEARQGKPSDARSDVYALGITSYWLLTGHKPGAHYRPPSELVKGLDEHWDVFVANCLDTDPDRRYQSVAKAKDDFENFTAIRPLRQGKSTPVIGTTETKTIFRHLDFIPVPEPVKQRGEKTARAFRLAIIGLFGAIASFLVFTALNTLIGDGDDGGPIAIRTPAGKEPRLSISVSPPKASVKMKSEDLTFLTSDGHLDLNILPGSYRFEFSAPGYQKTSRLLQIEREPQTLDIRLKQAWADVVFTGLPGTTLTATDKEGQTLALGATGADGKLALKEIIVAGDYTLEAAKPGYLTSRTEIMLSSKEPNAIEVPLEPVLGVLRVRSQPKGAAIFYEGKQVGVTNTTLEDLPVQKEFLITLKLEGYRDDIRAITVQPQTRTILDFEELTPLSGDIAIDVSLQGKPATTAELAQLTVEGQSVSPALGAQPFEGSRKNLVGNEFVVTNVGAGDVTMTVKHPDYHERSKRFTLQDKVRLKVLCDLQPLPATVTLHPKPADIPWAILIDGQPVEALNDQVSLPAGVTATLTVTNENFFPASKEFTPLANQRLEWSPTLQLIPGPELGEEYAVPFLNMPLAWAPAGSFTMGSPPQEGARLPEEGPPTPVTFTKGFWIGTHEINQAQYEAIMATNSSRQVGAALPVEYVTWRDAIEFCQKLNERESASERIPDGYEYRLPTEAEWEYAARAGSKQPFHWGDTANHTQGNFRGTYPRTFDGGLIDTPDDYGTKPGGNYQPNAWGLYDVHGNVSEWCMDIYNARLPGEAVTDWMRTGSSDRRAFRGGSFADFAIHTRAASRSESQRETTRSPNIGFRVVLGPKLKD